MEIKQLSLGALGTNCYVIHNNNNNALIVDPGDSFEEIAKYVNERNLKPIAILLTHAHFDHIGAVDDVRNAYNIKVYLHAVEHPWLRDPQLNGSSYFGISKPIILKEADGALTEGLLNIGDFQMEVLHTPGHSPGSVSFYFRKDHFVVAGDTLFQGSIGRTDLPGGHHQQLLSHIKNKLLALPLKTIVYPGHGSKTSIEQEKTTNPFLIGL
ncbi:MBL fold metallo-hydrolase [Salirhabdus sp. Marseille-P4669]|uniref:MBL fold metallo-hydrolase n=1 Tax=Salirhabdus sp. Marseille-P4669 TaxID=2042310 RepID=UPI000C7B677F|nr:MBL fold metallo-hydrolase [Salirhabdus sp. Marseille-P4669]